MAGILVALCLGSLGMFGYFAVGKMDWFMEALQEQNRKRLESQAETEDREYGGGGF